MSKKHDDKQPDSKPEGADVAPPDPPDPLGEKALLHRLELAERRCARLEVALSIFCNCMENDTARACADTLTQLNSSIGA